MRAPAGAAEAFLRSLIGTGETACIYWPFKSKTPGGYGSLRFNGRQRVASNVMCELIHGLPPTEQHKAAHSCGRGHLGCINPNHISWKTPKENEADKIGHGTVARGNRNGRSKITEADARDILAALGRGVRQIDLARQYGLDKSTLHALKSGQTWAHL